MKAYTVEQVGPTDLERHDFDPMTLENAKRLIRKCKVAFPRRKYFLSTSGNSGLGCYLNPDGNHSLTGVAW